MMDLDQIYMRRALDLAAKGKGRTSPNPMVGCVIVRDGSVIGEGYHQKAGMPHAEVNAVHAAGDDIEGATMYVTLEPCCHVGRTPPCTDLIIARRPARVVAAMLDPSPRVSGKGVAQLSDAGIQVETGVLEAEARQLNEAYVKYVTSNTPFVIAKCGMTLDGKIATRTGDSRWITCEAARRFVHELRDQVDAIVVGSRTVMMDDPSLTTRLDGGGGRDPVRVILDAGDYLDPARRVFHLDSDAPTWLAVAGDRIFNEADEVLRVPPGQGGLDVAALMQLLAGRSIASVLIEGGGTTLASAFDAGVVDKVLFFIAPKIVGGRDAVTAVEGEGAAHMDEAVLLERMTARPVGDDILIEAYVRKE